MVKPVDLKEILQKNPSISVKDLEAIDNLTRELRKLGLKPRGYRLGMPHGRRQAKSGCADPQDPRTVHLSRMCK
jgi:hypothetical protein